MKRTSYSFVSTEDLVAMVLADEDNEFSELEYEFAQRLDLAVNIDKEGNDGIDA